MILIKPSTQNDIEVIKRVEETAFNSTEEAQLALDLINDQSAQPIVSLLAYDGNKAIGHILFTRAYLNNRNTEQPLMHILAPLAVIPEYQNQGIGGMLIKKGHDILKEMSSQIVFVLGHISYYPKYGFIKNAQKLGYKAPYPIPKEVKDAWMVQSLQGSEFSIPEGSILCAEVMDKEEYWKE